MMEWRRLLSRKRWNGVSFDEPDELALSDVARTCFERDADRIVFSSEFRRLHDKTQVFPLSNHDVVHSRLTHSLEVASVGRSLGTLVGHAIIESSKELRGDYAKQDFGAIVYAACLAHDIGNPPFGHSGERAISSYFCENYEDRAGWDDFRHYEGNAQSFRILCSTSMSREGGMQLTAATLGAVLKYPRGYIQGEASAKSTRQSTKKNGVFESEQDALKSLAQEVGLLSHTDMGERCWCRHPLSMLVEAADDICYVILDVEDGVRLKLIDESRAKHHLASIASLPESEDMGKLRASAIDALARECAKSFLKKERQLRDGAESVDRNLTDDLPDKMKEAMKSLREIAKECCYRDENVIAIEMAGFWVLKGLLDLFMRSLEMEKHGFGNHLLEKARCFLEVKEVLNASDSAYDQAMRVVSYVGGMTDRYAMALYQRLMGISLPERGI